MCGSVVGCCTVQSEGLRPMMCSRTRAGFTLNIIDTPGLIEGGYINEQAVDIIKRYEHFSMLSHIHTCLKAMQFVTDFIACNIGIYVTLALTKDCHSGPSLRKNCLILSGCFSWTYSGFSTVFG
jgi:hypothetical protein